MGFFGDLFKEIKKARTSPPTNPPNTTIDDPVYRILTWETPPGWWVGTYRCPVNGDFRLRVDATDSVGREPDSELRTFFASIQPRICKTRDMAIKDFLPTFNEAWTDGETLTEEEFSQLLRPESIHIWSYGTVEVSYQESDDSEPLGGHALVVSFDTDGTTSVRLEG